MGKKQPKVGSGVPKHASKVPNTGPLTVPPEQKTPESSLSIHDEQVGDRCIVWRFGNVDHDGEWGLDTIPSDDVVDLVKKLGSFETMKIKDLFAAGSQHGKHYDPAEMPSGAQKRLAELRRDDETQISRVRLSGRKRLYGFMREHVFYAVWWDPKHQVWPSMKRNT